MSEASYYWLYTGFCIIYVGVMLLLSSNEFFFTDWGLTIQFLYYVMPPAFAASTGLAILSFMLNCMVAVMVTVIEIQSSTLMNEACTTYGCALAWTGTTCLHYLTVPLQVYHLYRYCAPLRQHIHRSQILWALLSLVAIGVVYVGLMDPVNRYDIVIPIHTFLAWAFASAVISETALVFFCAASSAASPPTYQIEGSSSLTASDLSVAGCSKWLPRLGAGVLQSLYPQS